MLSFLLELYGEQWYGVSKLDNKETIAARYVWIHWAKKEEEESIHWRKC
jgi:hypothetical protein